MIFCEFSFSQTCANNNVGNTPSYSNLYCGEEPEPLIDLGNFMYLPNQNSDLLLVKVNFHVMQKSASNPQNYTQNDLDFFSELIISTNDILSEIGLEETCLNIVTGNPLTIDSKIRFTLGDIQFYEDEIAHVNGEGYVTYDTHGDINDPTDIVTDGKNSFYCKAMYLNGTIYEDEMNVFFVEPPNASHGGWGPGYNGEVFNHVIITKNWSTGWDSDKTSGLLLHEIGHCLGLHHTWSTEQKDLFEYECDVTDGTWNSNNHTMANNDLRIYNTPLQYAHMRRLLLTSWRKKLLNVIPFGGQNFEVNENVTIGINDQIHWNGDIIVKEGNTLIVEGILRIEPSNKIIVEKGGNLLIKNGGLITSCEGFWDGIYAYGDNLEPQSTGSDHAIVRIQNEGIIENSENGIQLFDGAVGWFENASFFNNKTSIEWHEYNYNNFSYIRDSEFIVDLDYLDFNNPEEVVQIKMSMVRGIDIEDNMFENTLSYKDGIAILSMDAGYVVRSNNNISIFEGWKYGINAKGGCTINTFSIKENEFKNCDISILAEVVDNFEILENTFYISESIESQNDFEFGIMTDYCSGYDIAFNDFLGNNSNSRKPVGLVIKDSGNEPNVVEVNYFNNCFYSFVSNGDNSEVNKLEGGGLQLLCNQQSENFSDFDIPEYAPDFRISIYQGFQDNPAGNTFSDVPNIPAFLNIDNHDFTNTSDYMRYYYNNLSPNQYPEVINGVDRIGEIDPPNCRELQPGGEDPEDDKEIMLGDFSSTKNNFISYKSSLNSMSATDSQKANAAGLKLDFYRLINFGLFVESIKENRNYSQYTSYLSEKSTQEAIFLEIATEIEMGNLTNSISKKNTLSGEDFTFYDLYLSVVNNYSNWREINSSEKSSLEAMASIEDNRTSLASVNVLEYYFGENFDKEIITSVGSVIRNSKKKHKQDAEIFLTPNPAGSEIEVRFSNNVSGEMFFINISGKVIFQKEILESNRVKLNVGELKSGIYFVQFKDAYGNVVNRKMIKQ